MLIYHMQLSLTQIVTTVLRHRWRILKKRKGFFLNFNFVLVLHQLFFSILYRYSFSRASENQKLPAFVWVCGWF